MAFRQVRNDLIGAWVRAADANVEWRLQVNAVHDALVSSGWIQTGDTGQINLTTTTGPAPDVFAGYEIWRMNDTLQATSPIFMKIEYGAGGFVGGNLAMRIQVGSGSTGTGSLTGNLTVSGAAARVSTSQGSTTGDWNLPHYWLFSGDVDRFLFAFCFSGPANSGTARAWLWSIERPLDEIGVKVGGAYLSLYSTRDNDRQEYVHPITGGVGQEVEFAILAPRQGAKGLSGSSPITYPQYFSYYSFLPAGLNQMGIMGGALPTHGQVTVPRYGIDHVYYSLGKKFAGDGLTTSSLAKGAPRYASNTSGITLIARYDP